MIHEKLQERKTEIYTSNKGFNLKILCILFKSMVTL